MIRFWVSLNLVMVSDIQYTRDNPTQMHAHLWNSNNEHWLGSKYFIACRNYTSCASNYSFETSPRVFLIFSMHIQHAVKPVYKGHPRDQTKVAVMSRWHFYAGPFTHKMLLWELEIVAYIYRWPLQQVLLYTKKNMKIELLNLGQCNLQYSKSRSSKCW